MYKRVLAEDGFGKRDLVFAQAAFYDVQGRCDDHVQKQAAVRTECCVDYRKLRRRHRASPSAAPGGATMRTCRSISRTPNWPRPQLPAGRWPSTKANVRR